MTTVGRIGAATLTSLLFAAQVWAAPVAPAITANDLIGHRAVYDLTLGSSRGKRSIESVRGRILYDFAGSSCEGYALQFRQVSELNSGEGKVMMSDLRATTWEEGDAKSFRFNSQNFINQNLVDSVDGQAERKSSDIGVNLKKPSGKKFNLGTDVIFPTEHMRRILAAARAGTTVLELPVFDGSENGEKVYNTLSVIGKPIEPNGAKLDDATDNEPALAKMIRWPVTIGYFDKTKEGGEQMPAYSISFEIYENGISRALKLDYNDFVINGRMTQLEVKSPGACPK